MNTRYAAAALLVAATAAVPAFGLTIVPTWDSTITSDPNAATIEATINQAINFYQSTFSDPISVSIDYKEMSSGLGQSNTLLYKIQYQTFINALTADATSANDATALAHLPTGPNNPVNGTTTINLKTANIRALGITGIPTPTYDGTISLNTSITNLSRSGPQDNSKYDLLAVVEHEMDEVLGLGSDLPGGGTNGFFNDPAPEDLFRYDTLGNRNYTISGDNAWFSIDGTHDLVQFNQSGGGADYGDWHTSITPRVQDAFATPGAQPNMGVEVTALDVIGYDLVVPEPASIAFFALAGLTLYRRRRSA